MAERPTLATVALSSSNDIPVIDFSRLLEANKDEFLVETRRSLLLVRSGIFSGAMNFFNLPLERTEVPNGAGTVQGYGQAFVFSEDQKLDWCNMFALGVEPHYIRNPKLWPKSLLSSEVYSREIRNCANLLRFIAMSIGLNGDTLRICSGRLCSHKDELLPAVSTARPVLGLSPHSDGSALTILQQGRVAQQAFKSSKTTHGCLFSLS
ncbi:hypothetical protein L1049_016804 [Liquidambar formosana]|uniref:Non-haem dioxygenase N-terminal domain-containing protein n=1 Tax=Liquidambar formosana TaxID=63359 RepID=A0AAP0RZT2_LIQFO